MAFNVNSNVKMINLQELARRTKVYHDKEMGLVAADVAKAFKSGKVEGNKVNLYTSADQTGEAAFSFDFPKEQFLDQAKTSFVTNFAFSEETYPGATNPNLEGKPVMVLAVKGTEGETETVNYSFLDMAELIDTYTEAAGDGSATVTVSGREISVNVNISEKEDNALQKDENGKLYVTKTDTSNKADKVSDATDGNLAGVDAEGNLTDSGVAAADVAAKDKDAVPGNIAIFDENGNAVDSGITFATDEEVTEMLDEIFGKESAE